MEMRKKIVVRRNDSAILFVVPMSSLVAVLVDEYDKPLLQALGNFIYRISGGCQQSASIDLSERLADYQGL